MVSQIPGFGNSRRQSSECATPHECGDIRVPWNVGQTVFWFRAPMRMSIKNQSYFAPLLKAHRSYGRTRAYGTAYEEGPRIAGKRLKQTMQLQPMDLIS